MSGEVNKISTLENLGGGGSPSEFGRASLEPFSGEAQLKKTPCIWRPTDDGIMPRSPILSFENSYLRMAG